jgi:hypothetical protein
MEGPPPEDAALAWDWKGRRRLSCTARERERAQGCTSEGAAEQAADEFGSGGG